MKTDHENFYLVMRKMGHVGTQIESVYRLGRTEIAPTEWPRPIKTELKQGSNERKQILRNPNKLKEGGNIYRISVDRWLTKRVYLFHK